MDFTKLFDRVIHTFYDDVHEVSEDTMGAKITSAFISALTGTDREAEEKLRQWAKDEAWGPVAQLFIEGLRLLPRELQDLSLHNDELQEMCNNVLQADTNDKKILRELIWKIFFPEYFYGGNSNEEKITAIQTKRRVEIHKKQSTEGLQNSPYSIAENLIFSSNVLLTVPQSEEQLAQSSMDSGLKERIRLAAATKQQYWFDHPVFIACPPENNEILYGLVHLNKAMAFEKQRGVLGQNEKIKVFLSVSVTHESLAELAAEYLQHEFSHMEKLEHLDVFLFTERDSEDMLKVLFSDSHTYKKVAEVFGVNGMYGRHYSFLKAMPALWQVAVDSKVRATFKIDLDQIFPQELLVQETGKSACELLRDSLWGASGTDSTGTAVEFGMVAGALVNEKDIAKSLFTPDVGFPDEQTSGEEAFFYKQYVQALSTRAEMMLRYDLPNFDGIHTGISRIHVTGGTNGILMSALRKYRPFTPSFIGRAEDQAYLLSVLHTKKDGALLRYAHVPGLIMRHDKSAFAGEAIKAAKTGTYVGDLVRMLYFSRYAECIEGGIHAVKQELDPFTGCFISSLPLTVVYLRLFMKYKDMQKKDSEGADQLLHTAGTVLQDAIRRIDSHDFPGTQIQKERSAWNIFYDKLDLLQTDTDDSVRKQIAVIGERCRKN